MKTELTQDQIECLRIFSRCQSFTKTARAMYMKPKEFAPYFAEAVAMVAKEMNVDLTGISPKEKLIKCEVITAYLDRIYPPPWER